MLKRHSVLWFVILTLLLSFGVYFLPLPVEQRSVLVPVVMVLVPTLVSIPLAFLTEGREGMRQLFQRVTGAWKWALIGIGIGVLLRAAVLLDGILQGMTIRPDLSVPGTTFVILAPIPLAWFEELGWRRFALHRMLRYRSPFASAIILGLPWSIVHLVLLLPGMMAVGAPAFPQTVTLVALSVILTWLYVRSGGSLLAVTLLHGTQTGLAVINRGIGMAEVTWLMMDVYVLLAALLVIFDRRMFFARPVASQAVPAQA